MHLCFQLADIDTFIRLHLDIACLNVRSSGYMPETLFFIMRMKWWDCFSVSLCSFGTLWTQHAVRQTLTNHWTHLIFDVFVLFLKPKDNWMLLSGPCKHYHESPVLTIWRLSMTISFYSHWTWETLMKLFDFCADIECEIFIVLNNIV